MDTREVIEHSKLVTLVYEALGTLYSLKVLVTGPYARATLQDRDRYQKARADAIAMLDNYRLYCQVSGFDEVPLPNTI